MSKGSCLGEGHAPSLPGSDTLLCLRDFAKSTIILNQNKRLASKLPFPPVGRLSSKSRWNREAAPAKIEAPRGSGGTGRRARLRILWPKGRGGSNPSFRTKLSDKESLARANIASRGTFSDDLPDGWCCYSSFVQRARTTVVSRAIRPVGFGQHASGKARGVRQTRHAACGRRASSSLGTSCRANGE